MSAHSGLTRARHPNPKTYEREAFQVSRLLFEVCDHPEHGKTFALFDGGAPARDMRRPLFSGFVGRGMSAQIRALADQCDRLDWGGKIECGRIPFLVGHVLFEFHRCSERGHVFDLIAGEATPAKRARPLFSAGVQRGMGTQLRRLAHRFDELEAGLPPEGGQCG
ncbi:hypothetical protein PXK58_00815 [Phaeobacter gallaeciensis]|uniref:hypothetical protein n=1 Tax=Phaeobacter gallaeciensis TaxID=60890 RepID=UPI002380B576|nr:hypothetical protein [Phaeobacter gallaeciensis]MDE4272973.1 hypothetical protein [Phaeobacter gallaeciensis]MDE4298074.1 hypothetical protein [Phaeobacter gallaeciensis]MDE5183262.1 hypothetical protein [Phaeobacter gallaeciensis]